ncbi:carbohydrate ABC transporter permease [Planobispora siamensis]|uniref:sn-glycerol-3-phosphate transport system permease protein UgpE n=1 Tax=Planobispora siamensis TaxID=936338 RepID=A0A8J3SBX9_9ACTN|nr:carbohydrate ABC transporter permease [Planobispora siamensis]GIH91841.1 sn-glycerol-3-phosphate transport system permease protein UgpE [Planobispora siamensis]
MATIDQAPGAAVTASRTREAGPRASGRVPLYLLLVLLSLFFLFPVVFMLVSSLKPDDQIFQDLGSGAAFLPVGELSLDNYAGVFDRVPAIRFLLNSVFVTVVTVLLGLFVNSLAGFALSRMEWRGRKLILALVIATLIIPFETVALPMVYWVAKLPWLEFEGLRPVIEQGWLNSYQVQILPFVANAFSIFLFAQYFGSIPRSLDEAARVDGCGWFRIYRKVVVPLSGPVFATVAILTFLPVWNSYLWPLMVVQEESKRPVMIGVQYFNQLTPAWGETMAYSTLITIPVLVVFLSFQRAFVRSIAASGVKG